MNEQLYTIDVGSDQPHQMTENARGVDDADWSPDGKQIAYVADNSVFVANSETGNSTRLTSHTESTRAPRPEACVFSPDGHHIAYVRRVPSKQGEFNQIFIVAAQ